MHGFEELIDLVNRLAVSVGFASGDTYLNAAPSCQAEKMSSKEGDRPAFHHWRSSYAQILLCFAPSDSITVLHEIVRAAQGHLDEMLVKEEAERNSVVDGYLLVALNQPPTSELSGAIRDIELDTHLCRKHVVWQGIGDTPERRWARLWRATVIGLPESMSTDQGAGMPRSEEYDSGAIWKEISKGGPNAAAKRELEKAGEGAA